MAKPGEVTPSKNSISGNEKKATGAGLIRPPPDKGSKYIIPWDDLRGHHPMEDAREKKGKFERNLGWDRKGVHTRIILVGRWIDTMNLTVYKSVLRRRRTLPAMKESCYNPMQ